MDQPFPEAKFAVDDSDVSKNNVKMRCAFPVAIYPCNQITAEEHIHCNIGPLPGTEPNSQWPAHVVYPDLQCVKPGEWSIGGDYCDEKKWACSGVGSCDAYEKTHRLCASKLAMNPYFCYYAKFHPDLGIRRERSNFPSGWMAGGIIVAIVVLACWVLLIAQACKAEEPGAVMKSRCISFLGGAALFGIFRLFLYIGDKFLNLWGKNGSADWKKTENMDKTLQDVMAKGQAGNFTLIPERALPEGWLWWHYVLLFLGIFIFCGCMVVGLNLVKKDEEESKGSEESEALVEE